MWQSVVLCALFAVIRSHGAPTTVDYNRDVKPILSDRCYTCHGPDQAKRTNKLRLDTEAGAKRHLAEVVQRISTDDKARRMPPVWSGASKLSETEVATLTKWIEQGAKWQNHWSFAAPVRTPVPESTHPVDYFVRSRLAKEGLKPSPEADRSTLIRRVSLDLTGIPPTPAEVDAFLRDSSPNAYEKVVDRLLASSRYGERMAIRWLDAARYADTNGYQSDGERSMWRWRDWVIDAFNRNLSFDRFTVEQLAGDMLPQATQQQIIATGFNRNHRGNGEGGIIPEEYAVEYVVDRVDTTSAVWLGMTVGCARCHDHKYDPFSQKEFYQMFAYFNNVPERGKSFKYGNSPPWIHAPVKSQTEQLQALDEKLAAAEAKLRVFEPKIAGEQTRWERNLPSGGDWTSRRDVAVSLALDGNTEGTILRDPPKSEKYAYQMENGPVAEKPQSLSITPEWRNGSPMYAPGLHGSAAAFDGTGYLELGNIADFGFYDSFSLAAWIFPKADTGAILSRTKDEAEGQGFSLHLKDGRVQANLVQRWLDDGARIETKAKLEPNRWSHVMLTYDGTRTAAGVRIYIDGKLAQVEVHLDDLNQSFAIKQQPLRIGTGLGPATRFRGLIDEVRVYRTALNQEEAARLAVPETLDQIARVPAAKRSPAQASKLRSAFLDEYAPAEMKSLQAKLLDLRKDREQLLSTFPTVMVMQESATPRATHVLLRGAYDRPGPQVSPGIPAVLSGSVPKDRLAFARWLVDQSNPLTARVIVNRYWQMYFGNGIVKTVDDFGAQGEWPSHPELLDWLATEFVRTGWDVKAMQKLIVTSATYRQSSRVTPELLQKDPENRLLARGTRLRLSAEMVRDQALAISGLLVEKLGGPSVKPYQPAGLWKELTGGEDYRADKGEGLYRRSLYTYWKRTAPPPMMMNFDAAGREACSLRETRTNTPLQSLNLMNDVTYLEAARVIGERMLREGGNDPAEQIAFAFKLATSRDPKPREKELLLASLNHYRDLFRSDPPSAEKYLSQGEKPRDRQLDSSELAAYATVASLILNLDAVVTKD